ncbi:2OG-Fe(II) oxygenase family protein [Oceanicaulis alexandrii]|uniref:2OG-Fe(II) oxygenase n=1 Tax=Oceanicaulis alexandrii TaxID=153233 RepID=UPI0035D125EA
MAQDIELTLRPGLDPAPFAEIYARDKLVSIPDILPDAAANAVHELLRSSISWRLIFPEPAPDHPQGHKINVLSAADIEAIGRQQMAQRIQGVMARAKDNYGYLYNAYPMIEAYMKGWDSGHPIHRLTEFLNSPAFLEFGRAVIGEKQITKADAQATLYTRGHFLTRHVDEGYDRERRAAYTFGFTPEWQPDWGGLLLLLDSNFDIQRGLLPRFNTLNIFDGTMVHAVSAVSPFAGGHRLQITGWLRDDPPAKPS